MSQMEWIKGGLDVLLTLAGLLTAVFVIRPTVAKHLDEYRNSHKVRMRSEAEFALKLAVETGNSRYKGLAFQLGLTAVLGNPHLHDAQRQVLMDLDDPVHWAERYEKCEQFVQIDAKAVTPFRWRTDYAQKRCRTWFRIWRFCVVVVLMIPIAVLPKSLELFSGMQTSKLMGVVGGLLLLSMMFGTVFLILKQFSDLNESEKLIADAPKREPRSKPLS